MLAVRADDRQTYMLLHRASSFIELRCEAGPFLAGMLAARPDLRGHIDGVAIHPWGPNPAAVLDHVRSARAELRS